VRLGDRQSETDTGGPGSGAYGPPIVRRRAGESESTPRRACVFEARATCLTFRAATGGLVWQMRGERVQALGGSGSCAPRRRANGQTSRAVVPIGLGWLQLWLQAKAAPPTGSPVSLSPRDVGTQYARWYAPSAVREIHDFHSFLVAWSKGSAPDDPNLLARRLAGSIRVLLYHAERLSTRPRGSRDMAPDVARQAAFPSYRPTCPRARRSRANVE
jgi:hypothetical protein